MCYLKKVGRVLSAPATRHLNTMTAEQLRLARLFLESIQDDPVVRLQSIDYGDWLEHLQDHIDETVAFAGITQ